MNWYDIWQKKASNVKENLNLEDLIAIDGFDTGAGYFPMESWMSFVNAVEGKLNIRKSDYVLEVGCGGGAFLLPSYEKGIKVCGIDYAENLIGICKKVMPQGKFKVDEACSLPFDNEQFDVVLSNSVYQYFPDIDYAERSFKEMIRILKIGGRGAILDINDLQKKIEFESFRRAKLDPETYERLYRNISHMYYSKAWFIKLGNQYNLKYEIYDQDIPEYKNSQFRFNFYFVKV